MKGILLKVPQLGTIPPHRPVDVVEEGGTSEPGRAFSLRSDWAESSRGVGPPAAKKENPPFFSLLRTRWNVMVWSQTSQGGVYPRGKNRRKWVKEGSEVKTQPRRASSSPVVSDCGWTCLRLQWVPSLRMSSNRESCGFTLALSPSLGSRRAEVKFEFLCLPLCWVVCG